jgi:hypothetical protein
MELHCKLVSASFRINIFSIRSLNASAEWLIDLFLAVCTKAHPSGLAALLGSLHSIEQHRFLVER